MKTYADKLHTVCLAAVLALLLSPAVVRAQQKITVSYPGIAGYNIPFWVALDTGEFRKAGLDVNAVLIFGGTKSLQALLSGGLDFAQTSGGHPITADLAGADLVIVGTTSNTMSADIVAAPQIHSLQELKGKKVGIASFGGNNEVGIRFVLKKAGMNPSKDVVLFQVGGEKNRLAALERGSIAATIMSPPVLFVAESMGFHRLADLMAFGMKYPELSIVVRRRDLKERRSMVRKYLEAMLAAIHTFKTNQALTVGIIQKYIHIGSKPEAIRTYDYFVKRVSENLHTDKEGVREFLRGINRRIPGAARHNPEEFIDESVLQEALRHSAS